MAEFLATDRCDRCGAQAYTRWRQLIDGMPVGRELLFCAHHTREHAPALKDRFELVDDERAKLLRDEGAREPEHA